MLPSEPKDPQYPERLLPREGYVPNIRREDLAQLNPWLQRMANQPFDKCCREGNPAEVTPAAFGNVGLHDMSVNLISSLFQPGDGRWHQKSGDWSGGVVDIADYEGQYALREEMVSVYFRFSNADFEKFEFPMTIGDRSQFDKFQNAIVKGMTEEGNLEYRRDKYQIRAHKECHHNPKCLNYWHMIVRTVVDSEPPQTIKGGKSKYQLEALRCMVETLRVNATLKEPKILPINSVLFTSQD